MDFGFSGFLVVKFGFFGIFAGFFWFFLVFFGFSELGLKKGWIG